MTRKLKDMGLSGPVKMPGLEFSVGDEVELRSDDDGYVGARFKAVVLDVCAAERRAKGAAAAGRALLRPSPNRLDA